MPRMVHEQLNLKGDQELIFVGMANDDDNIMDIRRKTYLF